jgi:hypothetical protein
MSVQHSEIADADRHEPKGASTATAKTVLMSNGDGTTKFDSVSFTDLTDIPSTVLSAAILTGASSSASQNPSAADTNMDIAFGSGGTVTDASLNSSGVITFVTGGTFLVQADLNVGRDTGSTASILYVRALKNSSAFGSPVEVRLNEDVERKKVSLCLVVAAAANDTMKFQLVTDSDGDSGGGLRQDTPSASGWSVVPCAKLTVSKFAELA